MTFEFDWRAGSAVIDPRGNIVKRLGPVQGVLRTDSF